MFTIEPGNDLNRHGGIYTLNAPDRTPIAGVGVFPFERLEPLKHTFLGNTEYELSDFPSVGHVRTRIISQRMFDILWDYCDAEMVYFHPISVSFGTKEVGMFIMHFNYLLEDVLSNDVNEKGLTLDPIVDDKKLEGIDVFIFEKSLGPFCISERVKDELVKAGITGCAYQQMW